MNGKYFVGKKVSSFEAYHPEDPITGVRLTVDQSNAYFAGDMDGNVWEMHCPYGTQQMADNILASLRGQVYKGFEAQDAALSPEAELGDGITVNGLYTSLGYRKVEFGPGHFSTVSAPGNNEPDEEYKYLGQKDRDDQYKQAGTYSYIEKTSEEIKMGVKNDLDGLSAELTLTISDLSAHFEDSQKQQTADFNAGLDGLKFNLEDQISKQAVSFEADLKGIRTRVTDAEGNISSLEQTAKSLRSDLTSAEGDISSLEQTAKSLRSDITSAQGDISSVEQYAKSIRLSVTSGSSSSTLKLTAGTTTLSSASIQFQGVVDFINDGTTRINGSAIKTGTITATQIAANTITSSEIKANTITFGDLDYNTQTQINNRGIDSATAKTLITSTLVSSPTIAGGTFADLSQRNYLKMYETGTGLSDYALFDHYYKGYSTDTPVTRMGLQTMGSSGRLWALVALGNRVLSISSTGTVSAWGTWSFASATVTGFTAVFG